MSFLLPLVLQWVEPYIANLFQPQNANDPNSYDNSVNSTDGLGDSYIQDDGYNQDNAEFANG